MSFWDLTRETQFQEGLRSRAIQPLTGPEDNLNAAYEQAQINTVGEYSNTLREELFNQDVRAFEEQTGKQYELPAPADTDYRNLNRLGATPQALAFDTRAQALREQAAAAGVQLDTDYETRTNAELKRRYDVNQDILDRRDPSFLTSAAGFAGDVGGFLSDPVNQASLVAGVFTGGSTTLLRTMGSEAAFNALTEAATLPTAFERAKITGRQFGTAEALTQVGAAAVLGAAAPPVFLAGKATVQAFGDTFQRLQGFDPEVRRELMGWAREIERSPLHRVDDYYTRKYLDDVANTAADLLAGMAPRATADAGNFNSYEYAAGLRSVEGLFTDGLDSETAAFVKSRLQAETSLYSRVPDTTQRAVAEYLAKRERVATAYDINPDLIGRYEALTARREALLEELRAVRAEPATRSLEVAQKITELNNRLVGLTEQLGQRKLPAAERAALEAERARIGAELDAAQAATRSTLSQKEAEVFYEFSQVDGLVRDLVPDINGLWRQVDELTLSEGTEAAAAQARRSLNADAPGVIDDAQELLRAQREGAASARAAEIEQRLRETTGQTPLNTKPFTPPAEETVTTTLAAKPQTAYAPDAPENAYGYGAARAADLEFDPKPFYKDAESLADLEKKVAALNESDLADLLADLRKLKDDPELLQATRACKLD